MLVLPKIKIGTTNATTIHPQRCKQINNPFVIHTQIYANTKKTSISRPSNLIHYRHKQTPLIR
jgi:hypothetical protein